jgi:hypothetical protein
MFNSVNPFTEETFASFAFEEEVSINTKLEKAQEAFTGAVGKQCYHVRQFGCPRNG